jgi:hypothetical protein
VINPLTEAHATEVRASDSLMAAVRDSMGREGYGRWASVVNEHVIRAITIRLRARTRGESAAAAALEAQLARGYRYLPRLVAALRDEYEPARTRYPSIVEFYPRLLAALAR